MNIEIINKPKTEQRPWYKEPWLWLVIMLPVASVIAGITTVIIAYQHADDLVNDDYYKVGLSINQNIESERLASDLGLHGRIFFSGEKVQLQLQSESHSSNVLPEKLMIELFHPTLENRDVTIELQRDSSGLYSASFNDSKVVGRRYLRITPFALDWILKQEVVVGIGAPINIDVR